MQHVELSLEVTEYEIRTRHVMLVLMHIRNGPLRDLKSALGLALVCAIGDIGEFKNCCFGSVLAGASGCYQSSRNKG
jgi:hypothetical protein